MNRVTIGISAYNQANFLVDTIESALRQTVPCDIILVNDGSTDNTLEIASKYPIRILNQVNKGLPSARNSALMHTETEFYLPLDSDDILMENCVEKMLARQKETDADIVAPSFRNFGLANQDVILYKELTLRHFCVGNFIPYFSLFRAATIKGAGGYSPRMFWGYEDYHLTFNLLLGGAKLVTIQEPLVLYRTKENSMLTVAQQHHNELMAQIIRDFPAAFGTL